MTQYEEWARSNARLVQHKKTEKVARAAFEAGEESSQAAIEKLLALVEILQSELKASEHREKIFMAENLELKLAVADAIEIGVGD